MRLIDADALKKELEAMANNKWNIQVGSSKGLEDAIDVIDNAPTVEPYCYFCGQKEHGIRPQGEWIKEGYNKFHYICSNCGEHAFYDENIAWVKSNFCPHCGARMKGGAE